MTPATQLCLAEALRRDAEAYLRCVWSAHQADDPRLMAVLGSVAGSLRQQCLGHLDLLDTDLVYPLETDRLTDAAKLARQVGDDEEAEWLETCARANRVHVERIDQVTP